MMIENKHGRNLVSVAAGTLVAELATLPICTLKTRFQAGHFVSILNMRRPYDPKTALGDILTQNGVRGLYRASRPAIQAQMFSTSSKYVLYQALQPYPKAPVKKHNARQQMTINLFAYKVTVGVTTGLIVSLVTHPLDVHRVILQSQETWSQHLKLHQASKGQTVSLMYRGYTKSIAKVTVGSALFMPLYDTAQTLLPEHPSVAACCSAIVSTTLLHPIDYLKTRHMAGASADYKHLSLSHAGESALAAPFRGLSLNLLRVVPHFTIVMTLTDVMRRWLGNKP